MSEVLAGEAQIRRLIPHAEAMCLLQEVLECGDCHIVCRTTTHRDRGNPLALHGRLSALHLVEYGAQAMAIHGGLLAECGGQGHAPKPGVLAAARDIALHVDDLATVAAPLIITATRLTVSAAGRNYAFTAHADGQLLGQGRVLVMTATAPML